MIYYVKAYLIIGIIGLSFICGLCRVKQLDKASKLVVLLAGSSFFCELIAHFFALNKKNNYPIYNVFSLIEFLILSIYFNTIIDRFKNKKVGVILGVSGVLFGILNILLFQPLDSFNNNFLFLEGFTIICLCLYSFYEILLNEDSIELNTMPAFWFNTAFLMYWSATYLTWPIYILVQITYKINTLYIDTALWVFSFLMYALISIVFIRYPKMNKSHVK